MTSWRATVAVIVAWLCGGCCLGDNQTAMMVSRGGVLFSNSGTNVTLHCVVSGTSWNPFFDQIIWYKRNVQVNTGAVINAPFDVTERYLIDKQSSEFTDGRRQISVSLTVINVSLEDNGTYRCALFRLQNLSASANYDVVVIAPVTELRLVTNNSVVSSANLTNSVLQLYSSDTFVACEAVGGNPAPHMRVFVGKVNVTSQFEQVLVTSSSSNDNKEHVIRMESRDWLTDVDVHQGRMLKCVARVQTGHGRPDLKTTVTATIDVRFIPQVTCWRPIVTIHRSRSTGDEGQAYVGNDEVKAELKCTVKANPPVDDSGIEWTVINRENVSVTMNAGQVAGIFHALTVNVTGSNTLLTRDAVMLIPLVNYTSRDYSYYLLAKNDIGSSIRFDLNTLRNTSTSQPTTAVVAITTPAMTTETVTSQYRPMTSLGTSVRPVSTTTTSTTETVTTLRKPLTSVVTTNHNKQYVYSSTLSTTTVITTGTSRRRHQKESDRVVDSHTEPRGRSSSVGGGIRSGVDASRRVGPAVGLYNRNVAATSLSGKFERRASIVLCIIATVIVDFFTAALNV